MGKMRVPHRDGLEVPSSLERALRELDQARAAVAASIAAAGLEHGELAVLRAIGAHAQPWEQLCERVALDADVVSITLDALIERGLVSRRPSGTTTAEFALTDTGRARLARAHRRLSHVGRT